MSWFVVPNTNTLAWLKIQDHWVGHHYDLSPVTFMWRLPKIGLPPVIIYRWIFPKKNHPAIGVSMGIPHLWKPLPETSSENQWLTVDKIRWFLGSQPISSGQTKSFFLPPWRHVERADVSDVSDVMVKVGTKNRYTWGVPWCYANIFGGFHKGGYPNSSLDGLFHGKSYWNGWWLGVPLA